MSDLTEGQRIERARQAQMALAEFLEPAIAAVEADYAEKMIATAASTDPRAGDVIARLANGIKVARQVRSLIGNLVADGVAAKSDMKRTESLKALTEQSPSKARLLKIGTH